MRHRSMKGGELKGPKIVWKWARHEQVLTLLPGTTIVGRSRECDFRVEELTVSRKHLAIQLEGESVCVEDLQSSTGSWLNEQCLLPGQRVELHLGDVLRLGEVVGRFQLEAAADLEESLPAPALPAVDVHLGAAMDSFAQAFALEMRALPGGEPLSGEFERKFREMSAEIKDRLREYRLIQEVTEVLGRILNVKDLLHTALEMVADLLGADRGFILLQDEESGQLKPLAELRYNTAANTPVHDWNFSGTIARECFDSARIIILDDALEDPRFRSATSIIATRIRSVICLPLMQSGQASGVVYLDHLKRKGLFQASQSEFLLTFARQTAIALENAKLYTEAVTDDLTGLFNRKYSLARIQQEMVRAERYGRPLSLIMVDIDYFKRVNDRHGHLAGDLVLARVAEIVLAHVRQSDLACRYGGEEFALLLPETSLRGARMLAERIRKAVAAESFTFNGANFQVTASLGLVEYQLAFHHDVAAFLAAADQLLYQAKEAGRNRVVS